MLRNKARLLYKGYAQIEGIDSERTFSQVSKLGAIKMFLAIARFKNFNVYQMDVKYTFLKGNIEEEVYTEQLEGFILSENQKVSEDWFSRPDNHM